MLPSVQFQSFLQKKSREIALIVGACKEMRLRVSDYLHTLYDTIEAANDNEAWQIAITCQPDVIIADLPLNEISGLKLCRKLKDDNRTDYIPFIILTQRTDVDSKIEGLKGGADDFIATPFHVGELLARIHNLIQVRKRFQNRYAKEVYLHPFERNVQSADEKFIHRVTTIVHRNIDNNQFGVEMFAREVGLSSVQLYRKLHALTGQSPNDFVRNVRLEHSAFLLEKRVGNVSEVAYQVGFSTLSYFSKCFRDKFGCTPNEYAKNVLSTTYQSKVA